MVNLAAWIENGSSANTFSCFQIICMYGSHWNFQCPEKLEGGGADIKWNSQAQLSLTNSCADEAFRS